MEEKIKDLKAELFDLQMAITQFQNRYSQKMQELQKLLSTPPVAPIAPVVATEPKEEK
jgi:hypothetical protein